MSLTGDLTIKGVTKSVTLAVTRFKCTSDSGLSGRYLPRQCERHDQALGIQHGQISFLASNDVALNLIIGAVREQPPFKWPAVMWLNQPGKSGQ